MLKRIRLKNFKNFKKAEVHLDNFSILIGVNASGKSNIRDALRFLHGISRGYNLAEIMGEKYVEGGVLQWRGIRGGRREITFQGANTFSLESSFYIKLGNSDKQINPYLEANYYIEVNPGTGNSPPSLVRESLTLSGEKNIVFEANFILQQNKNKLAVKVLNLPIANPSVLFSIHKPIISQLAEREINIPTEEGEPISAASIQEIAKSTLQALSSMRFLDLDPDVTRMPSLPGQSILGDRGENLSSVLLDICQDPQKKETLLEWIQELTPMDAKDFEFPTDFTGKILLSLVEENGQKISAYSASDGTLRFLAIIAALLGAEPAKIYFFEELDNGIHPTRLHLLLQLMERQASLRKIQIIATTHSSQLLRLLSPKTLQSVSLTYRLEDSASAQIIRVLDIPDAQAVLQEQNLGHLHESAWLENVMEFMNDSEEE